MSVLTVGADKQYGTIAAAVAATQDGDTVLVDAGTYTNDFFTTFHDITLQSVGGLAVLNATESPSNGKAIITTENSITIDGFGFTGAAVSDANGAGIRYEAGDMTVRNCVFWNNQDGILSNAASGGTILIQNSEFSHNGAGDGYSHNIYIGAIASLTVEDSYFHDSVVGHEIKSRALNTTIINNRIQDNAGDGSYSIDLPNGGNAVIQGNVIEKGANAENYSSIHFGGEGPSYDGSSLTIDGNTLVNDNANGRLVLNQAGSPVTLSNNQIWGYAPETLATGPVSQQGNAVLAARPALDLSSMAPSLPADAQPQAKPLQIDPPPGAHLQTWGEQGAVTASGHVLTVGAGGQFATLAQALVASQDGDTIEVAAGTYVNDFASVDHKVIIEGVGGMAHFVQQNQLWAPNGMLTINADATLRNLEFSGAASYSGHEGGVFVAAGNVTISNSYFHGNDIGIRTADNPDATLSIYGAEADGNGNAAKGTHNVSIGAIGSLTIKKSYIHGAMTGHELASNAFFTDIEDSRIIDGAGATSSFLIDLGQGGDAIIRNNVLGKGPDSVNGILIHVGNEGPTYGNSHVEVTGNTLVSNLQNLWHPYTFFVVGDDGNFPLAPIDVSGNTFIGGVPGSAQVIKAAGANNITAAHAALDASAPWSASLAPAASIAPAWGPNALTLSLAGVAGVFAPQFNVSVDGAVIGGGVVTADQAANGRQDFSFMGAWGAGAHTVTVGITNLQTRNAAGSNAIYIKGITLDASSMPLDYALNAWVPSLAVTLQGAGYDAAYIEAHRQAPAVAAAPADARAASIEAQPIQVAAAPAPAAVEIAKPAAQASAGPVNPPAPEPAPQTNFLVVNGATAIASSAQGEAYTGPFAGLQHQFINVTPDNLAIAAASPNAFIVTGAGNDAIDVSGAGGNNVLDGGAGSNFLVGGAGNDTFFLDARNPAAPIWSTVANFHGGDAATLWGMTPGNFALQWHDGQGAAGHEGLTLAATAPGRPNVNLTLAGYTTADLGNGRLSMVFGASPDLPGNPGNPYLYIHAN